MAMAYPAGRLYLIEYRPRNREQQKLNSYYVAAETATEAIEKLLKIGIIINQNQVINVFVKMEPVIV